MREPRRIWLALEGREIVEMKQAVLGRDVTAATAFFRRVVLPRVNEISRRRGIVLDETEIVEHNERLPG